jgi:hypothetical protein
MTNVISVGLAIFWGLYFTLAGSSNLADALRHFGLLREPAKFDSGNYSRLLKVVSRYKRNPKTAKLIFAWLFSWELAAAASFWLASLSLWAFGSLQLIDIAYAVGMSFFAALIIGNELFMFYESEEEHVSILAALLLSLLVAHLLS